MIVIPSVNIYRQFIGTPYAESFFVEFDNMGTI